MSAFVAVGLTASIGSGFYSGLTTLNDVIAANFTGAQNWTPPRVDPLILDLDGDGVETLGINTANPTLFDGNADGVRTATGWVKADDGFLVLDRNGNGLIDNGTELFGDATPLFGGGAAVDGFGALAQEDTTNDGVVNNQDLIIEVGLGQLVGRGAAIGQFVSLYNQSKDQFFQLTMQH